MKRPAAGSNAAPAPQADFHVLQQAAEWFALLRSPSVREADKRDWRAWHAADPAHQEAWARVEQISASFERLPAGSGGTARAVLNRASRLQASRRQMLVALLAAGGASAGAWAAYRAAPWQAWTADYRAETGARREIRLADGASVWLNTATALDVDYGGPLRRVILHRGEVLIQTEADIVAPARPFVVDTAHGRLRALGTRFSVWQADGAATVAVFGGAVEVRPGAPGASARIIEAGQQARFTAAGVATPVPADPSRQSWTRGLLVADDLPLGDFVAELARYRRGYLGCAPEVAHIRIVGTYSLADTDRVLAALEATLPVRVRTPLPWWAVVGAR